MARPTLHKNVNSAPRLRGEVRYLGRQRVQSGRSLASSQSGQREIAESTAGRFSAWRRVIRCEGKSKRFRMRLS